MGLTMLYFPAENQSSVLAIYNLAGQMVLEENTSGLEKLQINLEVLVPGTYVVCFVSEGIITTQRLVIR